MDEGAADGLRAAGGHGARGVQERAVQRDDAAEPATQQPRCYADVLGNDRAAEQRIDERPVAFVTAHQLRRDADHAALLQQVDGMDRPDIAKRVDDGAPLVAADQQLDAGERVLLRLDDDRVQAIGQRRFDCALQSGRHPNQLAHHADQPVDAAIGLWLFIRHLAAGDEQRLHARVLRRQVDIDRLCGVQAGGRRLGGCVERADLLLPAHDRDRRALQPLFRLVQRQRGAADGGRQLVPALACRREVARPRLQLGDLLDARLLHRRRLAL